VIDYMVMESVCLKVNREDREAQEKAEKERERKEFKKDRKHLIPK
jgi:hypothetical protein